MTPKCGSTYLYNLCKKHNKILLSKIKEVNFFSYEELLEKSYYKDFKVKNEIDYEKLFTFENNKYEKQVSIDFSVSYFPFLEVTKKIYLFNKDAKIVILYRNPFKRAFSHYLMDKRMNHSKKDFIFYLKEKHSFNHFQYVENSLFYKHSLRYINQFGKDNVMFINVTEVDEKFKDFCDFIGVTKLKFLSRYQKTKKRYPKILVINVI